jgi:uncharacterized protein (TIGR00369 family)
MSSTATPPDGAKGRDGDAGDGDGAVFHYRALERLYDSAPINALFRSRLSVAGEGRSRIDFAVEPALYHAAGAAHGALYFKMLDDAAFYAANTLVTDRFLLTTSFNLHFTRPVRGGDVVAEGRWLSGRRRVLVAEAWLTDAEGEMIGRGTGTFMRSHIPLSSLAGYGP